MEMHSVVNQVKLVEIIMRKNLLRVLIQFSRSATRFPVACVECYSRREQVIEIFNNPIMLQCNICNESRKLKLVNRERSV